MAKKTDLNKDKISQQSVDPSCPSTSANGPEKSVQNNSPNKTQQIRVVEKNMCDKTNVNMSKTLAPFSLEGKIAKIKMSIPLVELVTQDVYKNQVLKALNIGNDTDTLNLTDDKP